MFYFKLISEKTPSKKTPAMKSKSYPHSIEDLEKELEELKGNVFKFILFKILYFSQPSVN